VGDVGLTYRKNVALRCGCNVPVADPISRFATIHMCGQTRVDDMVNHIESDALTTSKTNAFCSKTKDVLNTQNDYFDKKIKTLNVFATRVG